MPAPKSKYSTVNKSPVVNAEKLAHGVKIYPDGTIEANGFRDNTDEPLEYGLLSDKKGFYFSQKLDDKTEIAYIPAFHPTKVYKTKVTRSISVDNAFATVEGKVKKVKIEELDRFKHSKKRLKNEIRKLRRDKKTFDFTEDIGNEHWNKIYIDSTTLGPYNYDTKLEVTKDIDFINDLIVVKTGSFNSANLPDEEVIVYVSPHSIYEYAAEAHYITTGEHVVAWIPEQYDLEEGVTAYRDYSSFNRRDMGITNGTPSYAVTSRAASIPKGEFLQHNHFYNYSDTNLTYVASSHDEDLLDTVVANQYTEHQLKMSTANWDGVIPAGAWFRLESWSTQSQFMGWEGEISVVPVDSSIECSFSAEITVDGVDKDYDLAIEKANKTADKKLFRKLNNYLIDKGIKNKNSRHKKYEKMLKYSSWNVYDWNMIRNENISKRQGVENIMYYDGTSAAYGGSALNSNYNYTDATQDKHLAGTIYGPQGLLIRDPSQFERSTEDQVEPTTYLYDQAIGEFVPITDGGLPEAGYGATGGDGEGEY